MGSTDPNTGRDLKSRPFMTVIRGYDRGEVDRFLDEIAAELDRLHEQLEQRDADEAASMLLLKTAAKTADELVADATAEAQRLRTEAFKEVAWARSEASVDAARLRDKTTQWAQEIEETAASTAARTNERAMAEAAAIIEQAELRAVEIAREANAQAETSQLAARQEATEAHELIEKAKQVMAAQAERLRSGAVTMADVATVLEARSTQSGGEVIDLADVVGNSLRE